MFLDEKRQGEAQIATRPDPFKLGTLIAWLEQQPADKGYNFGCTGTCALARYFTAQGFGQIKVARSFFKYGSPQVTLPMPDDFDEIACSGEHTFGAALARAREVAARV